MRLAVVSSIHLAEQKDEKHNEFRSGGQTSLQARSGRRDGELFEAALSDTRGFSCCERTDVVLNEPSGKYPLVEYWDQNSSYDTYLQWRTDTGIAAVLAPLIEGGWDGILG